MICEEIKPIPYKRIIWLRVSTNCRKQLTTKKFLEDGI